MVDLSGESHAAVDKLQAAIIELTPKQFDQLIVFLHRELEADATVDFVPVDTATPIDLEVTVPYLFGSLRRGLVLEQLPRDATVEASLVQDVASGVEPASPEEPFHAVTVVTTGTFSSEAATVAAEHDISLVNGRQLAALLIDNQVGIEESGDRVDLDAGFWELFRGQTRSDTVPSIEIPQADSIDRLDQTLSAVAAGNHGKDAIATAVESISGDSFDPRQADYYGTAGWLLGFLHKDLASRETSGRGRWGLTRRGRTYLEHREQGDAERAAALLHEQIRDIEIVRRILLALKREGSMRREAVTELVGRESELGGSTVPRRTRTLINWLELLPEIEVSGRGPSQQLRYVGDTESTAIDRTVDATTPAGDAGHGPTDTTGPADEDSILDRIMASFEQ